MKVGNQMNLAFEANSEGSKGLAAAMDDIAVETSIDGMRETFEDLRDTSNPWRSPDWFSESSSEDELAEHVAEFSEEVIDGSADTIKALENLLVATAMMLVYVKAEDERGG